MHCAPFLNGAPGRIRTCDLRIRSPALYPAELRARIDPDSNAEDISQPQFIVNEILGVYQDFIIANKKKIVIITRSNLFIAVCLVSRPTAEARPLVLVMFFFYKCLVFDLLIAADDDMENIRHEHYMHMALEEARKAFKQEEVPVGAVIVDGAETILARTHNRTIGNSDPSAHAEILALRQAGGVIQNYRLLNTTLYVSVEPCVMCMGAIIHARVARVVFGAHDPKWGAAGSLYHFSEDHRFNHHPDIIEGILADDCRKLMRDFFRLRRPKSGPGGVGG